MIEGYLFPVTTDFLGDFTRTAGLGAVEMDTNDMWGRSPLLLQRFGEESKRLVKEGAEVIVCMPEKEAAPGSQVK